MDSQWEAAFDEIRPPILLLCTIAAVQDVVRSVLRRIGEAHEATAIHHAARRRCSVAPWGTRAANGDAGDRISWCPVAGALHPLRGRGSSRLEGNRLYRRSECDGRISLGGGSV